MHTHYFCLENENKSHFHRIKSDELWFFHQGNALEILVLDEDGLQSIILGNNLSAGEVPQAMIPSGKWFASRVQNQSGFALVSCTVAPGFSFEDFELADRQGLTKQFPGQKKLIEEFTR